MRGSLVMARSGVAIATMLLAVACDYRNLGDYHIELPGDYQLIRTAGGGSFLMTRGRGRTSVIKYCIDEYGYSKDAIFGHVSRDCGPYSTDLMEREGYFIVEISPENIRTGLSEGEWRKALRKIGLRRQPIVSRPQRSHRARPVPMSE